MSLYGMWIWLILVLPMCEPHLSPEVANVLHPTVAQGKYMVREPWQNRIVEKDTPQDVERYLSTRQTEIAIAETKGETGKADYAPFSLCLVGDFVSTPTDNYKVVRTIAEYSDGRIGRVVEGVDRKGNHVAIKEASAVHSKSEVEKEYTLLKLHASEVGFTRPYYLSPPNPGMRNLQFLVFELLGENLGDLPGLVDGDILPPQVVGSIVIQSVDRVEALHKKGWIHTDIHPHNLMLGMGDNMDIVYLIDFGLATHFVDSHGQHIPLRRVSWRHLAQDILSPAQLLGWEASRRDDMQRLIQTMVWIANPKTTWSYYNDIVVKRTVTAPSEVCKGLEPEMAEVFDYLRKLKFDEKPNYQMIRNKMMTMIRRSGFEYKGRVIFDIQSDAAIDTAIPTSATVNILNDDLRINEDFDRCGPIADAMGNLFRIRRDPSNTVFEMEAVHHYSSCTEEFHFIDGNIKCRHIRKALSEIAVCNGAVSGKWGVVNTQLRLLSLPKPGQIQCPVSAGFDIIHDVDFTLQRRSGSKMTLEVTCRFEKRMYRRVFEEKRHRIKDLYFPCPGEPKHHEVMALCYSLRGNQHAFTAALDNAVATH